MMRYLSLFILILLSISCDQPQALEKEESKIDIPQKKTFKVGNVFADNQFDGARLNDFVQINDSTYQAIISPENSPVNRSPWFAFRLWSEMPRDIYLELKYTEHGHRYIPKTSRDAKVWVAMDKANFDIDTLGQSAILKLQLTKDTLWLAAQEVINSKNTYDYWENALSKQKSSQKKIIGQSVLKKPIYSYEFTGGNKKKTLVLIGRQHPPEIPGATLSLRAFTEELLSNSELAQRFRQNFDILIIPLLNPDGVDLGHWRHNANGKDLNRDWQIFSQPETQAVRSYLEDENKNHDRAYCFGIDFHTSYSGPYLLVLDSLNAAKVSGIIPDWIEKIEAEIPGYELNDKPRSQELPYCYNWFYNAWGIEAVTFEEGDETDRAFIEKRAKVYAQALMEALFMH